ncbi:MAG: hypothetical protein MJK18_05955, partial [Bdellovibrionales bacterium]|nr:hypothetical protein [Bdellovibrionales bacterium]
MLRLFLLGFISFSILSFSDDVRIDSGTYLYILDKINTDTDKLLYVEEVVDEDSTPRRFWLSFNPQNPVVEIYDNSWFDRFLKPVGDFQKARVARMVRDQFIKIDHNHYSNIKDRKDLYKYYPNNEMVPRSNMKVVQKANDFNQCQPSQKPPMRKNGLPCIDRGQADKLPTFIWKEISKAFEEDKELKNYYQKGWITPPMIAAAAH